MAIREIRIPKNHSPEIGKVVSDLLDIEPTKVIVDYDTCIVIEDKVRALPPENIKLEGIPFIGSPRKIRFNCPKCGKTIITTAQLDKENNKVDCEIKHCFNCGQEIDWSI